MTVKTVRVDRGAHGCEFYAAGQIGNVCAKPAFGKIDDEKAAFVHDLAELGRLCWLADRLSRQRMLQEAPSLLAVEDASHLC